MMDIYNLNKKLARAVSIIKSSDEISENNKKLITKFSDRCFAEGLSVARVLFHMNRLWNIARWSKKDFAEMTEDDIKEHKDKKRSV
jgi:hypothetical protein